MGSPILGSSDLHIIGKKRCSRKWVNKTEGHKILPMKQSKLLRLHLTENWARNQFRKIAYLQRFMYHSLAISKNFTAHQNKTPGQHWSPELLTFYAVITKNRLIYLMIYIFKQRAQHVLIWNNAPPHIRKPPHNRRLSPTFVPKNFNVTHFASLNFKTKSLHINHVSSFHITTLHTTSLIYTHPPHEFPSL